MAIFFLHWMKRNWNFFNYSLEEYKSETKLANFIKLKSVATKTTKITTQWIFAWLAKKFLRKKTFIIRRIRLSC